MNMHHNQEEEYSKPKKKTGPSPKYGPNQAKKMVSMRLSPDALNTIKDAAEVVFGDSQADVIEQVMRTLDVQTLKRLKIISNKANCAPNEVVDNALDLFCESKLGEKV